MPRQETFDYDALHAYIWRKTDNRGLIKFKQSELAEKLGIQRSRMSDIIRQFVAVGRIYRLTANPRKVGGKVLYRVVDPDLWTSPGQIESPNKPLARYRDHPRD